MTFSLPQLCSANREGHTPFISALSSQNYAAALLILKFVEKVGGPSSQHPNLFDRAVLGGVVPGGEGVAAGGGGRGSSSTLHHFLGGLCRTFDLRSMALYVHNLQLSTARQLLKLFQVRYPSAYKAEIIKRGSLSKHADSEASNSSDDGGSSSDHDTETLISFPRDPLMSGRARRPYHNIRTYC